MSRRFFGKAIEEHLQRRDVRAQAIASTPHRVDEHAPAREVVAVDEELWTIAEVAAYLRIPTKRVYAHIYEHGLPYRRVGRGYRFAKHEVQAWTLPAGRERQIGLRVVGGRG